MVELNKICTDCGAKQRKDGECWDYSQCFKCFTTKDSMQEIVSMQQEVQMAIIPSIHSIGVGNIHACCTLDQLLHETAQKPTGECKELCYDRMGITKHPKPHKEVHFSTPKEMEKVQQNMEWVVS